MQSFVVLGLIPGTNIQINFITWLIGFLLFTAVFVFYIRHAKKIHTWLAVAWIIYLNRYRERRQYLH